MNKIAILLALFLLSCGDGIPVKISGGSDHKVEVQLTCGEVFVSIASVCKAKNSQRLNYLECLSNELMKTPFPILKGI